MRIPTVIHGGGFRRGVAALGISTLITGVLGAPTLGADVQPTTSPAATSRLGTVFAQDEFNRTGNSLGTATTGGAWAVEQPTGLLELRGGAAIWSGFRRGQTTHAWLPSAPALDQHVAASYKFGLISRADYGMSFRTMARRQTNGDGYRTSAQVMSNGQVALGLSRVRNRIATPLASLSQAATLTSNKVLTIQTRVVGTSPVHVVARAWVEGTTVPAWQITYEDSSTAAVKSAGAIGMQAYQASTGAGRSATLTRIAGRHLLPPR